MNGLEFVCLAFLLAGFALGRAMGKMARTAECRRLQDDLTSANLRAEIFRHALHRWQCAWQRVQADELRRAIDAAKAKQPGG